MLTKTVRSRFNHEVGQQVAGCVILEKVVITPPNPAERRLGVFDYLVEVPPIPAKAATPKRAATTTQPGSFTRATPEEMKGGLIRRLPPR